MATATTTVASTVATEAATTAAPERRQFRDFNTSSYEARVSHLEIVTKGDDVWVAVTAITTLQDDTDGVSLTFTSSNGLLALARAGHLCVGRRIHVTGAIKAVESHYVNNDGLVVPLKRARIRLIEANVRLGAKPKADA